MNRIRAIAALLVLLAPATPAQAAQSRAMVLTSDFVTGGLSAVALAGRAVSLDVAVVHSDARVRWAFGKLYALNRFGADNVQVVDPGAGYSTVKQFSLGNGANPSDIVVVAPDKAYVSLYGTSYLRIVDPMAGTLGAIIDLRGFADADGLPEADRMGRFGRWLFVALQRLDRNGFVPTDTSLVAVIDTETDQVVDVNPGLPGVQAIVLPFTNPVTPFAWDPIARRFHLGCVGAFGVLDGGVAVLDPATFSVTGISATEAALGGDLGDLEWHTPTHAYAIVSDAAFNTLLISWNPTTGLKTGTLANPGGFSLPDCALNDRGELYVCNNGFTAPGLYVFSAANDAPIAGPLDVGLPPSVVVFDGPDDDVTGVAAAPSAIHFELGPVSPCPARTMARFDLALADAAEVRIEAFDLSGRRVATLAAGLLPAGRASLNWNLVDGAGRRVPPGVYLVRARVGPQSASARIVVTQ